MNNDGDRIYSILIKDYPKFFNEIVELLGTSDTEVIYSKINVYCENCNVKFTTHALNMLFLVDKMGPNVDVTVMSQGAYNLLFGKCPHCRHTKIKIIIK